jgi:DNA polymerase I
MQLIRPGIAMFDPASGEASKGKGYRPERRIGEAEVIEYFGVAPNRVVDVQSLAGDATDNVPGAPGIGIKTAAQLIGEYGDLDTLLARAGEIKQPKRRETLTDPAIVEKVRLSRKLVSLVDDVPVETPLAALTLPALDGKALVAFLKALEFNTITKRVGDLTGIDISLVEPDQRLAGPGGWRGRNGEVKDAPAGLLAATSPDVAASLDQASSGDNAVAPGPAHLAARTGAQLKTLPFDTAAYETVTSLDRLDHWIAEAFAAGHVAVDTETTALDAMQAELVGISLATAPGKACYIPLQHRSAAGGDLFGGGLLEGQIGLRDAITRLKPLLEDKATLKIGQNIKYDWLIFSRHGIEPAPIDDTLLLSYVLDAGLGLHNMDALAERHLGHKTITYSDVAGSGRNAVTFDRVPLDRATAYAAEDADVTLRLWLMLKPRLAAEGMTHVYETLERGMVPVLARMEARGIAIDRTILSRLSGEFAQGMARVEAEINDLVGERFNIASPKQLGDILFGKMGLPGGKRTATGQWSTSAQVLEDLAEEGHLLPARIVAWRQLSKLKSTYTDALPDYVNPQTKRVHTSFSLASTTTGRLSSSEPNIQNIPIRTEEGRKIRKAFVATPGQMLISADYSQIELRVLAHVADIPQLKQAFADGIDIHAMTASEMFGVPVKGMPSEVRRRAKAINFGIIYGISAFGLANQLGIPREEASAYIKTYFERFPGIRDYMETTKRFARENGYVSTIFGRKCHYPSIRSSNPSERAFMERAAINAPIQGSAADIIRRAMQRMEAALAQKRIDAAMLLQVHDELVFEVPEDQVQKAIPVICAVMQNAALPALDLAVPLQVEARAARNWDEAH